MCPPIGGHDPQVKNCGGNAFDPQKESWILTSPFLFASWFQLMNHSGAGKMAEQVKVLTAKPNA